MVIVGGVEGINNKDGGIVFMFLGYVIIDNFVVNIIINFLDCVVLYIDFDYIDSGNLFM